MTEEAHYLEIDRYCPIWEAPAKFIAKCKWYRGTLFCQSCKNPESVVVESETFPVGYWA
jgi:hypothetical protein